LAGLKVVQKESKQRQQQNPPAGFHTTSFAEIGTATFP
jgi:hypothetical protein